jgi:ABC-type lipoprotein release transport system permease subunit
MTSRHLVFRSLTHYWRTNLAVVAGVATAVAVLAGALIVGDSVRGTIRALALSRIGAADLAVTSPRFMREALADDLARDPAFSAKFTSVAPLIAMQGFVTAQASGSRAGKVLVYGVDDRFWSFHGVGGIDAIGEREALVSPSLAGELGVAAGDPVLVRVERPSAIPLESLHSDKDALGRTIRLTVARALTGTPLAEFSLRPSQGSIRAIFVPLSRLQDELELGRRINTLIASVSPATAGTPAELDHLVRGHAAIEDFGLRLRSLAPRQEFAVESDAGLLAAPEVAAVEAAVSGTLLESRPVLTYVANTLQIGGRTVPYSLVTAIDLAAIHAPPPATTTALPPIVLNNWASADLGARTGDTVRMEFFVWEDSGRLATRSAEFAVAGVVAVNPADRDFAPDYPGITDSPTIDSWDPPFPVDLRRIRPRDEAYWDRYRTAPKAFIPLDVGQQLWASRHGTMTSIRFAALPGRGVDETMDAFNERLRSKIEPSAFGLSAADVRGPALAASEGATDFGEYFLYFSFFLVVAALVLAALFFRLGIEQRAREIGLLRAVGVDPTTVRRLFLAEAVWLAVCGTVVGLAGAWAYASVVVTALNTWWYDAVGTNALTVHVGPMSLLLGAAGGVASAIVCTAWVLRGLGRASERRLLAGDLPDGGGSGAAFGRPVARRAIATAGAVAAIALVVLAQAGLVGAAGAFFGAGSALLVAGLAACAQFYRRPPHAVLGGRGVWAMSRLGLRNAGHRPSRSVLSIGVVAAAVFVLIAVDAFRRDPPAAEDTQSGTGGYALMAETLIPVVHDPRTEDGRSVLNLQELSGTAIERFRLRPGDDASCLNLYQPQDPRILGVSDTFIEAGRFSFSGAWTADGSGSAENAWRLLVGKLPDGAIPVIADATSMMYVLHRSLGEDVVIRVSGRPVRLRLVAALHDSIFQSELLMSDANFRELFPDREGFQVLLIETKDGRPAEITAAIENALADFGADVTSTTARLAEFHRVENTYLSTFQTLGGLGLLVGTVGLSAVLLRNVLERRRELALLGAVGYRPGHFAVMLTAESLSLLVMGLLLGSAAAALAVVPAVMDRGGRLPLSAGALLLVGAVFVAGLLATVLAARLATRGPLLAALRSE